MREAVRFVLELGVGQLLVTADQSDAIRHGVDGVLGEVGDIQSHGA